MEYVPTSLKKEYDIKKIYTIFYFEFSKNFDFTGEAHDFWEMVYVDKGEITVTADNSSFVLNQGEITFHKPNEYHKLKANGTIAPNIMILSFECRSLAMKFFKNKILQVSDSEKQLLSTILQESRNTFSHNLTTPSSYPLPRKTNPLFGSEQMLALSLMQLLISLKRSAALIPVSPTSALMKHQSSDIAEIVTAYLEEHITQKLSFSQITEFAGISASGLKLIFRKRYKKGVMEYFRHLKIERAKSLIRESGYNMTQIAAILGYESLHDFSRSFKSITGMSPSEYGMSVKSD